jgi:hypothetical protein
MIFLCISRSSSFGVVANIDSTDLFEGLAIYASWRIKVMGQDYCVVNLDTVIAIVLI